ncbi:MAG TPA: cobalamin-independent methionine synthase II family protein [Solirubrobacteraceae bacterium]|nr:cobalamin-independent methionine synthase II family protein [Solirubrobacteraceae bacterium]
MPELDVSAPSQGGRIARTPPRAESVGSLLRPEALKAQFMQTYGDGVIYANALPEEQRRTLKDLDELATSLVPDLVRRQIDAGIDVVTDGEIRRGLFTNSFLDAVDGIDLTGETRAEGRSADAYAIPLVTERLTKRGNPALREAEVIRRATSFPTKMTFPAASYFYFQMFLEFDRVVYADRDAMVEAIVAIERQLVDEVIEAGIRHVQFDFPVYPMLVDPSASERAAAIGETRESLLAKALAVDAKVVSGMPSHVTTALHLCRGNTNQFFVGSVEPIAERIFALPYDRFLFEWHDVSEDGSYEPIRFVPPGKTMVMGLVSTKTPELEDEDELLRQMETAGKLLDVSQLGISPQCGFASAWRGHAYDEETQWRKLELVGRVAERIWGGA